MATVAIRGPVDRKSIAVDETAAMLARAFHDDPPSVWLFPDETKRRSALRAAYTTWIRYTIRQGGVYVTDGRADGAAIWLPPDRPPMSAFGKLRFGFWETVSAPLILGLGFLPRLRAMGKQIEEMRKRDVPKRHWYLMVLGVDQDRQGQGLGSALIQPGLANADRDRLPCYLETAKEINVEFYAKHGFDAVRKVDLRRDGPPLWTMLREPVG